MPKICPLIMIARAIQWSAQYVNKDELDLDDAPNFCSECLSTDCSFWTTTHDDGEKKLGACSLSIIAQSITNPNGTH